MATIEHITVTVERQGAEQWLGVTEGLDVDATVDRYADRIEEALRRAYPDATIDVDVVRYGQSLSTPITIEADGEFYSQADTEQPDIQSVQDLLNAVFNGEFGDYAVEA